MLDVGSGAAVAIISYTDLQFWKSINQSINTLKMIAD
jgi:hypothetical protein